MDRRTKIIAAVFGALVVYGIAEGVVWPRWIDPLLSIDDRVEERRVRFERPQAEEEIVERAKGEYKVLAARVGSFDIAGVQTDILDRLTTLIEKHKLESVNVTPGRPKKDKKTHLKRMVVTVKATATLESTIEFLKDVSELPQLVRVGNAAIYPASRSRKARGKPRMNLRIPIEVLVLPQQKIVGTIDEAKLTQPESFARHQDRDYSFIWDLTPFTEYVPPKPLRASAGPDVNVKVGKKRVKLIGTVSGGTGPYTLQWSPPEELSDPTVLKPEVDTSLAFTRTYELTATDSEGKTTTDKVRVAVNEPIKSKPPRPPKAVDRRWKDGQYMQLRMTLLCSTGMAHTQELAIYNNRAKRTDYYAVGDEFDGGELVFVHPTGAVVRRNDEYFIYPIGTWLNQDIRVDGVDESVAMDYPQLNEAVRQHRTAEADAADKKDAAAAPDTGDKEVAVQTAPAPGGGDAAGAGPPQAKKREADNEKHGPKRKDAKNAVKKTRGARGTKGFPPLPEEVLDRLREVYGDRVDEAIKAARADEEQDSNEETP